MRPRLIRIAMTGLLAFLWLVQAGHCTFEAIPGLNYFACAGGESSESGAHSCCGGACKTVESRRNKVEEKKHLPAPQPDASVWLKAALTALASLQTNGHCKSNLADLRPELPNCWQFSLRTALPVRAPSFVS